MDAVNSIIGNYNHLIHELADGRSRGYFLVDNPWTLAAIIVFYCYFVLSLGPRFMKNRQAFDIKRIILIFDAFQVGINALMFYKAIQVGWFWKFPLLCYGYDEEDNESNRKVIFYFWMYYIVKITDFLDTVFFVLNKKFSHITFLHVYHHVGMVLIAWGGIKYYPVGHHICIGVYNTLVHVIMYSYYLMTTVYPQKKLFTIKKFVTQVQMYQFLLVFLHMSLVLLVQSCRYPRWGLFFILPNNLMIFALFYDFYNKTYCKQQKKS